MAKPDSTAPHHGESAVISFGDAWMTYGLRRPHSVVTVGGELFVYEAPGLRAGLSEVIEQDHGDLVLHLQDVTYLDSTCLGVLVGALKRLREAPGSRALRVVDDDGCVAKVLRITGLAQVLDLYNTVAAAMRAASAPPAEIEASPA